MNAAAVIAVNRFGLGAAPGELAAAAGDPRGWLAGQVSRPAPEYGEFRDLAPSSEALKEFPRWAARLRRSRGEMQDGAPVPRAWRRRSATTSCRSW